MSARDDTLKAQLARAGIGSDVAQAALDVDAILQVWRRKVFKRELGLRAIQELDLQIELAELDVLLVVGPQSNERTNATNATGEETMVSTVATRLAIDPSRASRLTSALIKRGFLRRAVSQQDARRAVLELTDTGTRTIEAARSYKLLVLGSYLKDWTAEEIATFLPLLDRFSDWSERAACPSGPVVEEIAALRDTLHSPTGGS